MLNQNQAFIDVIPAKGQICVISGAKHTDISPFLITVKRNQQNYFCFDFFSLWRFSWFTQPRAIKVSLSRIPLFLMEARLHH